MTTEVPESDAPTIDEIVTLIEKGAASRNEDENKLLEEWSFLIPIAEARIKGKLTREILKQRSIEQEESIESILAKADQLARLIKNSNYVIIYTGAGISTSASIPDYRGPNGLWTQIRKTGTFSMTKFHDLTNAEPTLTHMAIRELCRRRIVKHVVSQNCDGLHLRSGIPQNQLSEIHGNMYIEVCPTCEKQYFRQADITEKTRRFRHKTGRKCHTCNEPNNNLIDTIVLYGERSRSKWPMNWERAGKAAKKADLIICMGSSLKTLRRYGNLWPNKMSNNHKSSSIANTGVTTTTTGINPNSSESVDQTKLAIINLQYTPKDKNAVLKINGKCDLVMQLVMERLKINIPSYDWTKDPLIELAVPFSSEERQKLGRDLMFESRQRKRINNNNTDITNSPLIQQNNDTTTELGRSQSLFVSEMTNDPERRSLRMKIRAVNATPPSSNDNDNSSASTTTTNPTIETNSPKVEFNAFEEDQEVKMSLDEQDATFIEPTDIKFEILDNNKQRQHQETGFALPGWLGKGISNSRTSSYRRKRHGNKGRKHSVSKTNGTMVSGIEATSADVKVAITTTSSTTATTD